MLGIFNNLSHYQIVNINRHKNGHEVILETSGVPVYDDVGRFKGYRGIDRDITERIKTEQVYPVKSNLLPRSFK